MSILHLKPTSYSGDREINSHEKLENLALVTLQVYMRKLVGHNKHQGNPKSMEFGVCTCWKKPHHSTEKVQTGQKTVQQLVFSVRLPFLNLQIFCP